MGWLKESGRAFGFFDPIIPRRVELDEVAQTLKSRLVSRYMVTADCKCTHLRIEIPPSQPGKNRRLIAIISVVPCDSSTDIEVKRKLGSVRVRNDIRMFRRLLRSAPELRVGPITPISYEEGNPPDSLVSLLSVYAGQFGSYTTLLWQVPALGLTAQAFLLTIALMNNTTSAARIVACALSMLIAIASASLMHHQRGRAMNHAELLRRLSAKLKLSDALQGSVELDDATPHKTDAQNIWAVDHTIYAGWSLCMYLFLLADILIILAVGLRPSLLG